MFTKKHLIILQTKPIKFFKAILGVKSIEDFQEEIIQAVADFARVAIRATHSVGKTFIMGRIALWFLSVYKNSIVITTAPTHRQVIKLLWGELRSAYNNSRYPIGGKLLTNELKINDDWYAMGFSPQKEASASGEQSQKGSTFQGFHALYILVIFDEATGIPHDVWKMAEGLLTSGKIVKFVAIGNPTSRSSEFFKCFSSPNWKKMHINCFNSPNMKINGFNTKEDIEKEIDAIRLLNDDDRIKHIENYKKPVPYLLSAQWVISRIFEWGINHPLTKTKIFGEFSDDEDNVIVKLSDVENAIAREYTIQEGDKRFIGIDIARFGEDLSVFTEIIGNKITEIKAIRKKSLDFTAEEACQFILRNNKKTYVIIDGTGVGSGVVDMLKVMKRDMILPKYVQIIEVNYAEACKTEKDKKHYVNLKSKMFFELGKDLENLLDIPQENIYLEELPAIKYFFKKGKMQMESKDDYKKRTGKGSPDYSDSLAMANYARRNFDFSWFNKQDEKETKTTIKNETMAGSISSRSW